MSPISKELLDSLPPFLAADVQLWFCLFESAMLVHKIDTEDLKFHILICSLPPNVSCCILNIHYLEEPHKISHDGWLVLVENAQSNQMGFTFWCYF